MTVLIVLGLAATLLVIFDLAAIRFGIDSRDGFGDESLRQALR